MAKDATSATATSTIQLGASFGVIDAVVDDTVAGWLLTPDAEDRPLLLVDGRPAELVDWPQERHDVQTALKIADGTGFSFRVPHLRTDSLIELFAIQNDTLKPICSKRAGSCIIETSPLHQLVNALNACMDRDSVAVTCWDAAHNPVGRAKVLYDIIETHRPAVLFAYLFEEFGAGLWPPLRDTDIRAVLIPWEQRDVYHTLIRQMGISFDTVWLCKPRYPTFCLAEQIASPGARLIVDLDDNEEHFAASAAARDKPYGGPFLNRARDLLGRIPARTSASVSLQETFGGELVRHARAPRPVSRLVAESCAESRVESGAESGAESDPKSGTVAGRSVHVGFVGTVRPHKNILAAARALRLFGWATDTDVVFHVYGDVKPDSLRNDLVALGVRVRETVPSGQLVASLEEMDVILTGFPSTTSAHSEVTRYQITAKIGDALCAGRPVLVPDTESVADLRDQTGVFLFDEATFGSALKAALDLEDEISLPEAFTLDRAYAAFEAAERVASVSPKADAVLDLANFPEHADPSAEQEHNLLLVWKQNDAGLYGRRVDQIARTYRRLHPGSRVIVLELMHEKTRQGYIAGASSSVGEAAQVLTLSDRKASAGHIDDDGVIYREIRYRSSDLLPDHAIRFLADNGLNPANTVIILFPIISFMEKIQDVLAPFPLIVDVVDNQFSWANTAAARKMANQYGSLLLAADHIVFNSSVNRKHFRQRFEPATRSEKTSLVSNWYNLPSSYHEENFEKFDNGNFNIFYSGNMNDRIDWSLVEMIADLSEMIRIHLVGSAERAGSRFHEALKKQNIIYHGVMEERSALRLLRDSQMAIMPHIADEVSNFMNPLKLHMYAALGVPVATTCVEGITSDSSIVTRHADRASLIRCVANRLSEWRETGPTDAARGQAKQAGAGSSVTSADEREYVRIINSLRPPGTAPAPKLRRIM